MTDYEINERIAVGLGVVFSEDKGTGLWSAEGPGMSFHGCGISREHLIKACGGYTVDLNAIHAAEKSLSEQQYREYVDALCDTYSDGHDPDVKYLIGLTAKDKALVLVEVLRPKWEGKV